MHDPSQFSENLAKAGAQAQRIIQEFINRQADNPHSAVETGHIGQAFMEWLSQMMRDPSKLWVTQMQWWNDYLQLLQHSARTLAGEETNPVILPDAKDKRFKDKAWQQNVVFDFIKQSYLLSAKYLQNSVKQVEGIDEKTFHKVDFYTRQFVDAMAPSNFLMTNPEVLRTTLESGGDNLVKGLQNMVQDLERGRGDLRISMTDMNAFEVGKNLASTPGKVIYRNELMELIQYQPLTPTVFKVPLLIMSAWINKYYIMDLRQENSMVRWLLEQGYTVFAISWVNPDGRLAQKDFDDYLESGPLAALDAIERATGEKQVAMAGYCLGGTLMAITLAYLKAKKQDHRVVSATYLTTMVDFTHAGELSVFIDEEQLQSMEARMNEKGYLEGAEMSATFNMLRANDLIWSFVVNNYLLGKDPFPFDLLYWNADSTRMPAAMHSFYLRNMYQNNRLIKPGALVINGVKIDLRTITTPTYILSCREDHIAPWKSTYAATHIYGGDVTFVLAASGHIAGVINPPASKKYCFWNNNATPRSADAWFEKAEEVQGSWWPHWHTWQKPRSGTRVNARTPGAAGLKALENAPGSYVKVMS